jgi:hypothetical protein
LLLNNRAWDFLPIIMSVSFIDAAVLRRPRVHHR